MRRMDFSIGVLVGVTGYFIANKLIEANSDQKWRERVKLFHIINNIKK